MKPSYNDIYSSPESIYLVYSSSSKRKLFGKWDTKNFMISPKGSRRETTTRTFYTIGWLCNIVPVVLNDETFRWYSIVLCISLFLAGLFVNYQNGRILLGLFIENEVKRSYTIITIIKYAIYSHNNHNYLGKIVNKKFVSPLSNQK